MLFRKDVKKCKRLVCPVIFFPLHSGNADGVFRASECISLERDVFPQLASLGKLLVHYTTRFWSQIKSPG